MNRRAFLAGAGAAALGTLSPALAQSSDLAELPMGEAIARIRRRAVSPVDLVQACLARIKTYDGSLHSFITVIGDKALAEARTMEAEGRQGRWRGPLHGVPIALKDNIDTAGVRTTGASRLFDTRVPATDAEVARRLKQAGAILLGKLNLHEFAYGGSSTVTAFGTMHNPWRFDRVTGGSSGGPGVAVAAGFCYGSLGTDTAGSIRMPASHCGIVGLKPTYGRVSTRGVMTLSWTLDHVGPMCRTVEDTALMLNTVAGYDAADPTAANVPIEDYTRAMRAPTTRLRVGLPQRAFYDNLDTGVATAMQDAIGLLEGLTASTADVLLPPTGAPNRVWAPEALAYHAKWIAESPDKYQPGTRQALLNARTADAAQYVLAVREVEQSRRDILKTFERVDVLVTPTMKTPAPLLDDPAPGGGGNNNAVFDIFGLPTISIPCGFSTDGLPIGLSISGAPWAEGTVLALAHAFEQATEWHTRRPALKP